MGFMDKAKKLADQAQSKLDEVQSTGARGSATAGGPIVEYDQHGRPIRQAESSTPPHGDPLMPEAPSPTREQDPHVDAQTESASPPHGDPLLDASRKAGPPPSSGSGMTSGDPLG